MHSSVKVPVSVNKSSVRESGSAKISSSEKLEQERFKEVSLCGNDWIS